MHRTASMPRAGLFLLGLAAALSGADSPERRMSLVATASQPGVVGYRDPLGAVSPDGAWLAFTSGRHLRVRRLVGGPVLDLGPADRNWTHLAWLPDSRRLAGYGRNPDTGEAGWLVHDVLAGTRAPLWPGQADVERVRQLAWARDGSSVGVAAREEGSEIWRLAADGSVLEKRPSAARTSFPAVAPDGTIACLALAGDGVPHLSLPCGTVVDGADEAYGPLAFSPDGRLLYYARPNQAGTLDLWARGLGDGRTERLTVLARDSYAPTVTRDGRVLFKLQDYATHVATVAVAGGPPLLLTTFQSETPSWHPSGREIGVTYGSWRRVIDDFQYPDIAQDLAVVSLDAALPLDRPTRIVSATPSEDQSLSWSPNGRFIALHSHFGPSDDIFLMPADLSRPPRQITTGGSETGWPRWSPDGRFIVYTTDTAHLQPSARRLPSWERPREQNSIVVVGVDQETGEVTAPQQEVPLTGFEGQPLHAEWASDSERLFFDSNDGGDRRSLNVVARTGGKVARLHAFESEQGFSGIGVSPDGGTIAFVAAGANGYYQIFRVPSGGGTAVVVTTDPSHKTQPSFSPDGRTLAFTIWRYEERFLLLDPPRGNDVVLGSARERHVADTHAVPEVRGGPSRERGARLLGGAQPGRLLLPRLRRTNPGGSPRRIRSSRGERRS